MDIAAPNLDISPDVLPVGFETAAYNVTLSGSGGTAPYDFIVNGGSAPLPSGLSLATNGTISGTPAPGSAGTYTVQLAMGDSPTIPTGPGTPPTEVPDFTFVTQTPPTITAIGNTPGGGKGGQ